MATTVYLSSAASPIGRAFNTRITYIVLLIVSPA